VPSAPPAKAATRLVTRMREDDEEGQEREGAWERERTIFLTLLLLSNPFCYIMQHYFRY
jgi:hypothetical protein